MPEQPPSHTEVNYETSDATLGPIVGIGMGVVLLGVMAYGISLWMFDGWRDSTSRDQPELPTLAAKERAKLPQNLDKIPAPRLQVNENADLNAFRKAEEETLSSYGWVDAKNDKVRIPIDEAMRLLASPDFAREHGIKIAPAKQQPKGAKR